MIDLQDLDLSNLENRVTRTERPTLDDVSAPYDLQALINSADLTLVGDLNKFCGKLFPATVADGVTAQLAGFDSVGGITGSGGMEHITGNVKVNTASNAVLSVDAVIDAVGARFGVASDHDVDQFGLPAGLDTYVIRTDRLGNVVYEDPQPTQSTYSFGDGADYLRGYATVNAGEGSTVNATGLQAGTLAYVVDTERLRFGEYQVVNSETFIKPSVLDTGTGNDRLIGKATAVAADSEEDVSATGIEALFDTGDGKDKVVGEGNATGAGRVEATGIQLGPQYFGATAAVAATGSQRDVVKAKAHATSTGNQLNSTATAAAMLAYAMHTLNLGDGNDLLRATSTAEVGANEGAVPTQNTGQYRATAYGVVDVVGGNGNDRVYIDSTAISGGSVNGKDRGASADAGGNASSGSGGNLSLGDGNDRIEATITASAGANESAKAQGVTAQLGDGANRLESTVTATAGTRADAQAAGVVSTGSGNDIVTLTASAVGGQSDNTSLPPGFSSNTSNAMGAEAIFVGDGTNVVTVDVLAQDSGAGIFALAIGIEDAFGSGSGNDTVVIDVSAIGLDSAEATAQGISNRDGLDFGGGENAFSLSVSADAAGDDAAASGIRHRDDMTSGDDHDIFAIDTSANASGDGDASAVGVTGFYSFPTQSETFTWALGQGNDTVSVSASATTTGSGDADAVAMGDFERFSDRDVIDVYRLDAGDGDDTITFSANASATGTGSATGVGVKQATIDLGAGDDTLIVNASTQGIEDVFIFGGGGDDVIDVQNGTGRIDGGIEDTDLLALEGVIGDYAVDHDGTTGITQITGANGTDLLVSNFENIQIGNDVHRFADFVDDTQTI